MAIRYDANLNAEIRRSVKNFNQKRNRAIKRGFSYLPKKESIREIKQSFTSRAELKRYLKQLQKFNNMKDSALEVIETAGGGKISRYNLEFIKDNLKDTKAFFDRQISEARYLFESDPYSIARKDYLFNLEQKRKYLELDINALSQSGLKTFERYTRIPLNYNKKMITGYKGFLSSVEKAMRLTGYDEKTISKFYEKMSNLTPAQFLKMYRGNDLVTRIYDLVGSPKSGPAKLNTSDEDAKKLIDLFNRNLDKMMYDVKNNGLEEFAKSLDKDIDEITTDNNKIKKSELTAKELQDLKELGWTDLIDESA